MRDSAFQCHDAYLKVLVSNAQRMKEAEEKQLEKGLAPPQNTYAAEGGTAGALGTLAQVSEVKSVQL